ncbi:MAG: hypothetical protein D3918_13570 [Candidatus Electrothrix sp. AX2]|nr:hypothetical protein [Candidatus Electrothrix gigas]
MSFSDEIKQAWNSLSQENLMNLMRFAYRDEDAWKDSSAEFIRISEKLPVTSLQLFQLAHQIYSRLIGGEKVTWQFFIIPYLLNFRSGKDFDAQEWTVAAAGGKLPDPAWQDVQGWVQDWTRRLLRYARNFQDSSGLFEHRAGEKNHRPAIFHPFILYIIQQYGIPANAPFTAQELAEWIFRNSLLEPAKGASVSTGFASGPAILALSQKNLLDGLVKTFEANCLCDKDAPAAWQGKEKEVQQLLDSCPFWREAKLAASLRELSLVRLKNVAGAAGSAIKTAAGSLPSFRNVMSDAASFPLPEFRSADHKTIFWEDDHFSNLTESLHKLETEASKQEKKLKVAAEASKAASLGCHAFSSIAGTPLCSAALPQIFSELNLREYSVRLLLTQQLRSAITGTADNFLFSFFNNCL